QRLHVAVQPGGIREDEGNALDLEDGLIAAWRLALAAVQVEILLRADVVEHLPEIRMHLAEDPAAAVHQLVHRPERAQRRAPFGIDAQVPGAEDVDAEQLLAALMPPPQRGSDGFFVRLAEVVAVLRSVVEA